MLTLRRSGSVAGLTALALAAAVSIGCADSSDGRAEKAALPMCSAHDFPGNSVRVNDSQRDSTQVQFGQCAGHAPCLAEQLAGVVAAMGDGIPPDFDFGGIQSWTAADTHWIKIDDTGRVWTIVAHGLLPFPFRKGSAVSASYLLVDAPFSPDHSALELRVNGELAFYYGFGGGVDDIDLPREVTLERGAASCESFDDCLSWSEYDLRLSVNGSEPVTLRTGETKLQSGYLVKNFRTAQQTGGGPQSCNDGFVADTTILVARRSLLFEEPDPDMDAGL